MGNIRFFFPNQSEETDFKTSLNLYCNNITPAQFAATLCKRIRKEGDINCDVHFFKSGVFSTIFKVSIYNNNDKDNYFLKFFRNKTSIIEYTPQKMKNLCLREYLTLNAAYTKFSSDNKGINVVRPIDIIPDLACFITAACNGRNLQTYLNTRVKMSLFNPLNYINNRTDVMHLNRHIERIAELLAKIHELKLDYKLFKESHPFHVLDFDYKKQKFLENLRQFDVSAYPRASRLLAILTQKANKIFSTIEPTGLATPDANLSNFIINGDKIHMMDFFLIQHGPCYQPIGKFVACLELILYPFISTKVIAMLKTNFIETYKKYAERHALDSDILDFFINWNYMTISPSCELNWKFCYHKWLLKKKIEKILESWEFLLNTTV